MAIKLTPSRVRDYLLCPRLYQCRHLESRDQPATSPALAFGNSLHRALEALHRPGAAPVDTAPEALLRQHWHSEGYATAAQEAEQFAVGVAALTRYRQARLPIAGLVLATELYLSRIILHNGLRFELSGRIDRLTVLPNGTLEALDYKTNRDGQVPSSAELARDLPTFIYYLLTRIAYPDHSHVTLTQLNVLTLRESRADYTADQREMLKGQLLMAVAEIDFHHFPPTPGAHCAWCPYRADCPALGDTTLDSI